MLARAAARRVGAARGLLSRPAASAAAKPLLAGGSAGDHKQSAPSPSAAAWGAWQLQSLRSFATDALAAPGEGEKTNAVEAVLKNPSANIAYDTHMHDRFRPGDPSKRAFTYFVMTGGRFIYAATLRLLVLKFILSMQASKDVLAMASLEVDLLPIEEGQTVTVKWRGKPVFIRHRTAPEIDNANAIDLGSLRDPQPDSARVVNPEWLVVVGVCTHLGCVPLPNAGDYGGWFCPCHGSHYDISGRIRKGPAPYNLEVPQYKFLDENKLLVG
eukprot:jgi/Chlat1/5868/Chrsp4S06378